MVHHKTCAMTRLYKLGLWFTAVTLCQCQYFTSMWCVLDMICIWSVSFCFLCDAKCTVLPGLMHVLNIAFIDSCCMQLKAEGWTLTAIILCMMFVAAMSTAWPDYTSSANARCFDVLSLLRHRAYTACVDHNPAYLIKHMQWSANVNGKQGCDKMFNW